MTRLMIDLPEELEEKLRARATKGGYADPQDYVRALIAADAGELAESASPAHLTFKSKPELEKLLLEGINGGESREITAADWTEKRRQLVERHAKHGLP